MSRTPHSRRKDGRGILKTIIRLLITTILVVFIIWNLHRGGALGPLIQRVEQTNAGWLAVSAVIYGVSLILSALQWKMLLSLQGVKIPFGRVFGFYMIGQFFSNFLPTNWGGDFVRIYDVGVYNREWEKGTASIVMDRLLGLYFLFVVGLLAGFVFYVKFIQPWLLAMLVVCGAAAPVLFLLLDFRTIASRIAPTARHHGLGRKTMSFLSKFFGSLGLYQRDHGLLTVLPVAFATQLLRVVMNLFAAWSIGVLLPLRFFLVAIPVIGILTALPISINGIGVREYAGIWLTATLLAGQPAANDPALTAVFTLGYLVIAAVSLAGAGYFVFYKIKRKEG
jgi:uncharacterized protein (TIRG00374 family)